MKLSSLSISTGVIILLVCYILYLTQCSRPVPCPEGDRIRVDTEYVTTSSMPVTDTVYLPGDTIYTKIKVPTRKDSIVFVEVIKPVPARVDTQAVIQAYYSMVIQKDSMKIPGVSVYLTDTVTGNKIVGRQWLIAQARQSLQKQRRQFYFGGGFHTSLFLNKGLSSEAISAGHIDLGYINRKRQHFKLDLMRTGGRWHEGLSFYHTFGK